jgi:hypothetical protein
MEKDNSALTMARLIFGPGATREVATKAAGPLRALNSKGREVNEFGRSH